MGGVIMPSLVCDKCGCRWGVPTEAWPEFGRQIGDRCNDRNAPEFIRCTGTCWPDPKASPDAAR